MASELDLANTGGRLHGSASGDMAFQISSSASMVNLEQLAADNAMLTELRAVDADEQEGTVRAAPELFSTCLPLIQLGYINMVDDSFTRCFKSKKRVPWNWNAYLYGAWIFGVTLRYAFLFPLRLLLLLLGFGTVLTLFPIVKVFSPCIRTKGAEIWLLQKLAGVFVASWSGVIRFHGIRPAPRAGQPAGVFVANHSSMIDFIVLLQSHAYAVVGQHHGGWVGFCQDYLLQCFECVWFNRGESKDRAIVAERLRAHSHDPSKAGNPLLVFPEGTCVNNEYVVQFKKGVFELGVPINPIAIKYNKVFVDAYWNSREQSFAQHLMRLMTSWCVVADVWFLDPMSIRPQETPVAFAKRVQYAIADRAGLKPVEWDGYMKYWKPSAKFIEKRQQQVARQLLSSLHLEDSPGGPRAAAGGGTGAAKTTSTNRDIRSDSGSQTASLFGGSSTKGSNSPHRVDTVESRTLSRAGAISRGSPKLASMRVPQSQVIAATTASSSLRSTAPPAAPTLAAASTPSAFAIGDEDLPATDAAANPSSFDASLESSVTGLAADDCEPLVAKQVPRQRVRAH